MMLEDFFTLAEIKDGLKSPDRVKELMTVMQKEKDSVVKNVGDASTQWDTVANIIALLRTRFSVVHLTCCRSLQPKNELSSYESYS